ncbi:5-hydroxytryptamine receptor 3A-like [Ruditapes philippinarum]|uniref:5-hydroxytryptamine receptor 3A-like n=1 Tax=Ruditapes philippinarum TaxID=129788 RepID=UPI00295B7E58|nr:5-hydroxytryptamine receptor 3A-like [Ruditapes philippinarum]
MSIIVHIFLLHGILIHRCVCVKNSTSLKDMSNAEFMEKLFEGYSVNIPPVLNFERPVLIDLALYHLSIDNIEMKSKIISGRIIFGLEWTDEYLKWNSSDFKDISKLSLQPNQIWLPDLYIGNSEDLFTFLKAENVQEVILTSNGVVEAWLYLHIEVGIDLDIYKYPFDEQICEFEFSSWMHSDRKIDISVRQGAEELKASELSRQSGEWDIIQIERKRTIKSFDEYLTNFTLIQYKFSLKRKWQYTILNLVTPVVITSLLNPLSFLLPVDSGERISLSNTVFLTMAVFFSIVNHSLPKTSEGVPIIVAYIGLQMLGSSLTIVFTIFSLALYYRNQNNPSVFKFICGKIRKHKKEINDENGSTDPVSETNIQNNVQRESWMKASNMLDTACFWLSLSWNVVLLTLVMMKVTGE